MSRTIRSERLAARLDGGFVVFLIGMRINKPLPVRRWWPVAMPRMIRELHAHAELGFMHADSRKAVGAFHAAALANGGTSEGATGLRLHYSANFCAAYVRDPDGNKFAVVGRRAE